MQNLDLSSYSLADLKRLLREVDAMIDSQKRYALQKAREQIMTIAQDLGVPLESLLFSHDKKGKKDRGEPVHARFQNPGNLTQTWSGRGRQPKWISESLAKGKSLNDFRI